MLFSYSRSESKIPFHHSILDKWEDQKRINQTFMLSGIYLPDNGDLWKATVIYSPHKSIYTKSNIENGKFTNTGGGLSATLEWTKEFEWAKMKSYIGYKKTGNKIKHNGSNFYNYNSNSGYYPDDFGYCTSYSTRLGHCTSVQNGGYGTFRTEKETWTFKQDYDVNSFNTANLEHRISFGWEVNIAEAKYKRENDVNNYTYRMGPNGAWLWRYTLYPQRDVSARDSNYAAYVEDSMTYKRLNATLGLRFDHNEYTGNSNVAPRFSASYDVFGDQSTQLFGGVNRYYSGSVLSAKLRKAIGINELWTAANEAAASAGNYTSQARLGSQSYEVADLKTPYSDEYTLGFSQNLWDHIFTFKWVNRHGKDQYVRTRENGVYVNTNDGRSKNNTFSLTFRPKDAYKFKYVEMNWELGGQISKTEKNYNSYDASAEDDGYDYMILDGKFKSITDGIPATDYDNPWSAFLSLNTRFPTINLDWNQRFSYNSGYQNWTSRKTTCPTAGTACGSYSGPVIVYDKSAQGSYFMLDWNFAYKIPTAENQFVELTLDVNNVLNRKIVSSMTNSSSNTISTYKMGRNYWLGVSYNW